MAGLKRTFAAHVGLVHFSQRTCAQALEVVQKGLQDYLGEKRQSFARFYFLSDEVPSTAPERWVWEHCRRRKWDVNVNVVQNHVCTYAHHTLHVLCWMAFLSLNHHTQGGSQETGKFFLIKGRPLVQPLKGGNSFLLEGRLFRTVLRPMLVIDRPGA